jgi:hypothetical protein
MQKLLNEWRAYLKESSISDKPAYLLFHFPSKKLHWVETDIASASKTPEDNTLPKGKIVKSWTATSGKSKLPALDKDPKNVDDYIPYGIAAALKDMPYKGPLPPGLYYTHDPQDMPWYWKNKFGSKINRAISKISKYVGIAKRFTNWRGGKASWGAWRVWLEPNNADVGKRTGFSIHGGDEWGTSGCIDLRDQILDFKSDYMAYTKKYGSHMSLYSVYDPLPLDFGKAARIET